MNLALTTEMLQSVRYTGAVYTPIPVARAISELVVSLTPEPSHRILEPSVGDGAFLSTLATKLPEANYTVVDINQSVIESLLHSREYIEKNVKFHVGDFIEFACDHIENGSDPFDLIIGNPPFIRRHNFSQTFRDALVRIGDLSKYPENKIKNSWTAFLVLCSKMISKNGTLALILPYELMTVKYGQFSLWNLMSYFNRIDIFVPNERAFPAIDQDAVLFIGRMNSILESGLFLQHVKSLENINDSKEYKIEAKSIDEISTEINGFIIDRETLDSIRVQRLKLPKILDVCVSSPGIVTGANDFFILDDEKVKQLELEPYSLPILKRGSLSTKLPIFTKEDFSNASAREATNLIKISVPKEEIPFAAQRYLAEGEEEKLDQRYKCRHRPLWYNVPISQPTEGFFFRRSHDFPRLCINEAGVYITDNSYGVVPLPGRSIRGLCFSFYNSLTFLFSEIDGRFYGGGVLELSPSEFKNLPIPYYEPSEEEFNAFIDAHQKAKGNPDAILDFGDSWLANKLSLSSLQLRGIRASWHAMRSHRLRHGRR
ncbi:MAG: hypothetical protein CML23_14275 [Rhizobiaceae bacterium]|nr:hypothetical protein [Rhizobiaceae bacterium]